jgi:2-keto-4-pentenoate hydratase/2-oxohepta-3-ene-1,7-dioic acid hydratase in catechol pathway
MYLVNYEKNGASEIGVLTQDQQKIVPLPGTMLEFIKAGDEAMARAGELLKKAETEAKFPFVSLSEVKLLAPIPRPAKNIFCIGKNYREHALEFDKTSDPNIAIPKFPVIFTKAVTTVIGPNDEIDSHSDVTSELDYEVELAVVIGKQGTHIPKENAMDYVFGFTIINDVTARDLQKKHNQWFRGKSLDTFAPMGPYLVHKSSVARPDDLGISLKVNGELRQNANTGDLIFDIPTLIATISDGLTLEPGDIIATGTPAGVAMGFNPPKFLKPGDEMELSITGLGVLRNKVK